MSSFVFLGPPPFQAPRLEVARADSLRGCDVAVWVGGWVGGWGWGCVGMGLCGEDEWGKEQC